MTAHTDSTAHTDAATTATAQPSATTVSGTTSDSPDRFDAVIIGGGPAGLAAALMLGRSRRRTLVVDAGAPRNRFAAHMHGVLGHEGSAPGDLLARGRDEIREYGVELLEDSVVRVDTHDSHATVHLASAAPVTARAVIVASGGSDELPDIPGLAERWGTSVLHCPYCHGWEVRDRRLGVLATSPTALHLVQLVRQLSADVTLFTGGLDDGAIDDALARRLRARGVEIVDSPVVEARGTGTDLSSVVLADGRELPVDALFTTAPVRTHLDFLDHLELERTETPMGPALSVDEFQRTSAPRVFAAGNAVTPGGNVPMSVGAGTMTGAMVNFVLVTEDFDDAVAEAPAEPASPAPAEAPAEPWPEVAPVDYWEDRYAGAEPIWSGRPNAVLVDVASGLTPGRALDVGCGEGADAIWLAEQGWHATGIDISPTAVARARDAARGAGLPDDRVTFSAVDLGEAAGTLDDTFDLVTASFFHSTVALPRTEILRALAGRVAPSGHLLITSHAATPPWADQPASGDDAHSGEHSHDHSVHTFLTPDEEIAALELPADAWTTVLAETRSRVATGPDGRQAPLDDGVVLLRRER